MKSIKKMFVMFMAVICVFSTMIFPVTASAASVGSSSGSAEVYVEKNYSEKYITKEYCEMYYCGYNVAGGYGSIYLNDKNASGGKYIFSVSDTSIANIFYQESRKSGNNATATANLSLKKAGTFTITARNTKTGKSYTMKIKISKK